MFLTLKKVRTSAALALTLGMTGMGSVPLMIQGATAMPAPAKLAQLFPAAPETEPAAEPGDPGTGPIREQAGELDTGRRRSSGYTIPANTTLPVRYEQAEKIAIAPDERMPITLTIPSNIRYSDRTILIPAGSKIEGAFEPVDGGTRFVAENLVFPDGQKVGIDASSNVITRTEEIRRGVSTDAVLKGAAIGSGAAAILSGVTGKKRITLGKVLIGTGVGAAGGAIVGRARNRVYVVNPTEDMDLRLNSSLAVNGY